MLSNFDLILCAASLSWFVFSLAVAAIPEGLVAVVTIVLLGAALPE